MDAGVTGLLCAVRDSADLERQMQALLTMQPRDRSIMGLSGREKMEREFDERVVIDAYRTQIAALRHG
jgi:hypothetical protein